MVLNYQQTDRQTYCQRADRPSVFHTMGIYVDIIVFTTGSKSGKIFKLPGIFWNSYFEIICSTPMHKNLILKKAVHLSSHKSFIFEMLFFYLMYKEAGTHIISYVISHSFKKIYSGTSVISTCSYINPRLYPLVFWIKAHWNHAYISHLYQLFSKNIWVDIKEVPL